MSVTRATELPLGDPLDFSVCASGDMSALDDFARELGGRMDASQLESGLSSRRINADRATIEKDLAKLVLALVDTLRRLMERQAARRVNAGSLSDEQVEEMGETFLKLDRKMAELRTAFGLQPEDLNLSLGPIVDQL
jgi:hypothetical protein